MPNSVAVITMMHDEPFFLPLWYDHYAKQVGAQNLYVIAHGSPDEALARIPVGCSVIRVPATQSAFDEKRAKLVSAIHAGLLSYYSTVIYTDVDEILVPRPSKYSGLIDYCDKRVGDIARAVGVNVIPHAPDLAPIDLTMSILHQRPYGFASHWYFKPLVSSVLTAWKPGFHDCVGGAALDPDLWLFHLKYLGAERIFQTGRHNTMQETKAFEAMCFVENLRPQLSELPLSALDFGEYFEGKKSGFPMRIPGEFKRAF